jgi:hypothetical protein
VSDYQAFLIFTSWAAHTVNARCLSSDLPDIDWDTPLAESLGFDQEWLELYGATPLDPYGASRRLHNRLCSAKLFTFGDVLNQSPADLMKIRYFGRSTLHELIGIATTNRASPLPANGPSSPTDASTMRVTQDGVEQPNPAGDATDAAPRQRRPDQACCPPTPLLLDEWELFGGDRCLAQWLGVGVLGPSEPTWSALDAAGIEYLWDFLSLTLREASEPLGSEAVAELLDLIPNSAQFSRDLAVRLRSTRAARVLARCSDPPIEELWFSTAAQEQLLGLGLGVCSSILRAMRAGDRRILFDLPLSAEIWSLLKEFGLLSGDPRSLHRRLADASGLTLDSVLGLPEHLNNPREREVVTLRFGLTPCESPVTLATLASKYSLSRKGVRHIETRLLERISRNGAPASGVRRSIPWLLQQFSGVATVQELGEALGSWLPVGELCCQGIIRLVSRGVSEIQCFEDQTILSSIIPGMPDYRDVSVKAKGIWRESADDLVGEGLLVALAEACGMEEVSNISYIQRCLTLMGVSAEDRAALGRRPLQLQLVDVLRAAGRPLGLYELTRRINSRNDVRDFGSHGIASRVSSHPDLLQLTRQGEYWLAGDSLPSTTILAVAETGAEPGPGSQTPMPSAVQLDTGRLIFPRQDVLSQTSWREIVATLVRRILALPAPRSTCEMGLSPADVDRLAAAVAHLTDADLRDILEHGSSRRLPGLDCTNGEGFGLLLWAYFSELAREHVSGGRLWPEVFERVPAILRSHHFNTFKYPSHAIRFALDSAARCFQLRHVLDGDACANWYLTVFLQCGPPRSAYCNAATWLTGGAEPKAAALLRADRSGGTFRALWGTLRAFRFGELGAEQTRQLLERSPWVLPHWIPEILEQAAARIPHAVLFEDPERTGETSTIESPGVPAHPVRVLWRDDSSLPEVRISLPPFETLGATQSDYRILVNGEVIRTIRRSSDGSYPHPADVTVLGNARACLLQILEGDQELARIPLTLLDSDEEITVFDSRTGLPKDAWADPLTDGRSYLLAIAAGLEVEPAPTRLLRRDGWFWAEISPDNLRSTRISLDAFVVWEPRVKDRQVRPTPAWANHITLRVEGSTHPRFGTPVTLRVAGVPGGYTLDTARCGTTLLTVSAIGDEYRLSGLRVPPNSVRRTTKTVLRVSPPGGPAVSLSRPVEITAWGLLLETRSGTLETALLDEPLWFSRGHPRRIKVKPPSLGKGEARRWSVFEGATHYGTPSPQTRELRPPHALGEQLNLRLGLHNADLDICPLSGPIIDCGEVVQAVLHRDHEARWLEIILRGALTPRPGHQLWLWAPGQVVRVVDWDQVDEEPWQDQRSVWRVPLTHGESPVALGVAYGGKRIGAWFWLPELEPALYRAVSTPALESFEAMKRLRLPVLHSELRGALSLWASTDPAGACRAWLTGDDQACWLDALRLLLLGWSPEDPDTAHAILTALDAGGRDRPGQLVAVERAATCFERVGTGEPLLPVRALSGCPFLALKSLKPALRALDRSQRDAAARLVRDLPHDRAEEPDALAKAAEQIGVDPYYVQAIAEVDRDLRFRVPHGARQQQNLLLALQSPAYCDYLAIVAAHRLTTWLCSRR